MESLDDFGSAEFQGLIEELGDVRTCEIAVGGAAEKIGGRDWLMSAVEATSEGGETGEFAAGCVGGFVGSVVREVHVAEEGHPIKFNGFGGFGFAGYGRWRREGELLGVGSFEIEGDAGLRIDERGGADLNFFEIFWFACGERREQRLIGGGEDFAAIIVRKAFGEVADFGVIEGFVAVVRMCGNWDVSLVLGGVCADLQRSVGALVGRLRRGIALGREGGHDDFYCTYFGVGRGDLEILLAKFSKKEV